MSSNGVVTYANNTPVRIFARATPVRTKKVTVKSGQVLKGKSLVQSDGAGKVVAFAGFNEAALVTFAAITAGQTMILAGLTFTAGGSGATAAQLASAWAGIAAGATAASLTSVTNSTHGGTFTSGTMTGYFTESVDSNTVVFNSATSLTNATDVAATGTGAGSATITITAGTTTKNMVAGILTHDVDASAGDVDASAYEEACFWDTAIVWAVDTSVDTITKADGSTVAVTTYNTGASGTSKASFLLKQKALEGTKLSVEFAYPGERA